MTDIDALTELADRVRAGMPESSSAGDWYRIENADGARPELYLYGRIGSSWRGVTAAAFVRDLAAIGAPAIDVHINSEGGLVFDGVTIYSALRRHRATINVSVDGLAASAASFVAQAGDTVSIARPGRMMIHDAQGLAMGNAADMTKMAALLDEMSNSIAGIYADRAGGTVESWRAAMRTETWYSGDKAVAAGLADQVHSNAPADRSAGGAQDARSQMVRARARLLTRGQKA